jgi:NAD-dependent dihydropyrimidine dehydrogenase PreA subunit
MIELVSALRCITCNKCVQVCPMNVFEAVKNAPPIIARQADCQSCYMCELYCPTDALYVAPDAERVTVVDEPALAAGGLLGSYRRAGWVVPDGSSGPTDQSFKLRGS